MITCRVDKNGNFSNARLFPESTEGDLLCELYARLDVMCWDNLSRDIWLIPKWVGFGQAENDSKLIVALA